MISIFDIFKIGIGPSSSHTFGPMVAANMFLKDVEKRIDTIENIVVDLYGSLALTGRGHATYLAIELGLEGWQPENIKPNKIDIEIERIKSEKKLFLSGKKPINYDRKKNFIVHKNDVLSYHSNGMIITATDKNKRVIFSQTYYSVGGGFVITQDEINSIKFTQKIKYNFADFQGLMEICQEEKKSIYEIVLENEKCFRSEEEINKRVQTVIDVMQEMIQNGLNRKGNLEGTLDLSRRAPVLLKKLKKEKDDPLNVFDWIALWALAGAEENASLGKLITAPTNGAAALIPAVVKFIEVYYKNKYTIENLKKFVLIAGVIGILCKTNATISGAEGGCQAEIGVACAMASAGLCALLGGNDSQIENASVMGLVHNLGLICDPIGGLVQIPCIERNAINAVKAITCAKLAIKEKKSLFITLDQAILTLKQVGRDIQSKYRETSLGGLAVNSKDGRKTIIQRTVINNCEECGKCK
ncbi:MAG: L-serine ammonia-lyase [Rickettsiales bacterium]|jgi:L-serine dehydratase|nr:L-serine ammonia-lyase [Rickettsiales bacterium]